MSNKNAYLGIDSGVSGGAAIIRGNQLYTHKFTNLTEADTWLRDFQENHGFIYKTMIESVHGGAGEKNPGALMENYGKWQGLLTGHLCEFKSIPPQVWQKPWRDRITDEDGGPIDYNERKRILKTIAQELYPNSRITFETADAVLIARFMRDLVMKS